MSSEPEGGLAPSCAQGSSRPRIGARRCRAKRLPGFARASPDVADAHPFSRCPPSTRADRLRRRRQRRTRRWSPRACRSCSRAIAHGPCPLRVVRQLAPDPCAVQREHHLGRSFPQTPSPVVGGHQELPAGGQQSASRCVKSGPNTTSKGDERVPAVSGQGGTGILGRGEPGLWGRRRAHARITRRGRLGQTAAGGRSR